jgi:hypothetical protein
MVLVKAWMRQLVGASGAALIIPVAMLGAVIALAFAGGLGRIGSLGQALSGPQLPSSAPAASSGGRATSTPVQGNPHRGHPASGATVRLASATPGLTVSPAGPTLSLGAPGGAVGTTPPPLTISGGPFAHHPSGGGGSGGGSTGGGGSGSGGGGSSGSGGGSPGGGPGNPSTPPPVSTPAPPPVLTPAPPQVSTPAPPQVSTPSVIGPIIGGIGGRISEKVGNIVHHAHREVGGPLAQAQGEDANGHGDGVGHAVHQVVATVHEVAASPPPGLAIGHPIHHVVAPVHGSLPGRPPQAPGPPESPATVHGSLPGPPSDAPGPLHSHGPSDHSNGGHSSDGSEESDVP